MTSNDLHYPLEVQKQFLDAVTWLEKNDYHEAIQIFQRLQEEHPEFPNTYNHLGSLYAWKFNDLSRAEVFLKKGLEVGPTYLPTYYTYANVLQQLQRYRELEALLKTMETLPGISMFDVYEWYGAIREAESQYSEAIRWYKKAADTCMNNEIIERLQTSIRRCKNKKGSFDFSSWDQLLKNNWFYIWLAIILYFLFRSI